ncbi:MAG: nucleotidyl transferase AbiEii/AbiGii toxin family protein [Ktedonobacteraceae bacterium]
MFTPRLDILPHSQRLLWDELESTPRSFVLYGGTALALRLGHRASEDFDFFTTDTFASEDLLGGVPFLKSAAVVQAAENTLVCAVERRGRVQMSYFGGLDLKRIHEPDIALGNRVRVASLLDLAGCKVAVVQQRAAAKDYWDIAALMRAGIDLPTALAAGRAVYGERFDAAITLRALGSFDEGDLNQLDQTTRKELVAAAAVIQLSRLPFLKGRTGLYDSARE